MLTRLLARVETARAAAVDQDRVDYLVLLRWLLLLHVVVVVDDGLLRLVDDHICVEHDHRAIISTSTQGLLAVLSIECHFRGGLGVRLLRAAGCFFAALSLRQEKAVSRLR